MDSFVLSASERIHIDHTEALSLRHWQVLMEQASWSEAPHEVTVRRSLAALVRLELGFDAWILYRRTILLV